MRGRVHPARTNILKGEFNKSNSIGHIRFAYYFHDCYAQLKLKLMLMSHRGTSSRITHHASHLKILHLIHRYYPELGGAERHMRVLSNYLAAQGHEVTVVTSDAGAFERFWDASVRRIKIPEERDGLVTIRRFPIRHVPLSKLLFPALRRLQFIKSKTPLVPLSVLRGLSKLTPRLPALWEWVETTDEQFDLIAGMTITLEGFPMAGQKLAWRLGVPFVCYPLAHLGGWLAAGAG